MLLALGNKARNGKDTAGEAIVNYYNNRRAAFSVHMSDAKSFERTFPAAKIFKFADELYRIAREEYGMTEKDPTLLQQIGNGRRHEFGDRYWIDKLAVELDKFKGIAVVTDVRYTNEADFIKSRGGYNINVTRLNIDGTQYVSPDRDPYFVSEVQLDSYNWDFYIRVREGDVALTGEQAITIAEYTRALRKDDAIINR